MKALVFKASGDYARFRCPYTTTSALTYTVMHPIAIKGLLGAIMGIDYLNLYEYTQNMKIGIEVIKPIRKDIQSFNLVPQTKNNGAPNFQSRIEFLRDVSYKIYIIDDDEKLRTISDVLINRNYIFTPYLGASEHIAKLEFESLEDTKNIYEDNIKVSTVVPKEVIILDECENIKVCLDRIPIKNKKNREYVKYEKVAFVPNGEITTNSNEILKVGESNVYFF
jgi:CRISPR-associated protein Cas5h